MVKVENSCSQQIVVSIKQLRDLESQGLVLEASYCYPSVIEQEKIISIENIR